MIFKVPFVFVVEQLVWRLGSRRLAFIFSVASLILSPPSSSVSGSISSEWNMLLTWTEKNYLHLFSDKVELLLTMHFKPYIVLY